MIWYGGSIEKKPHLPSFAWLISLPSKKELGLQRVCHDKQNKSCQNAIHLKKPTTATKKQAHRSWDPPSPDQDIRRIHTFLQTGQSCSLPQTVAARHNRTGSLQYARFHTKYILKSSSSTAAPKILPRFSIPPHLFMHWYASRAHLTSTQVILLLSMSDSITSTWRCSIHSSLALSRHPSPIFHPVSS